MNRALGTIDLLLPRFLAVLMAILVVDVSWQVMARFVIRRPSSFTEELATFLLIWIGLLGGAYALGQKAHLGVDALTSRLPTRAKLAAEVLAHLSIIGFAVAVLIRGGLRLVYISLRLNQISAALRVKMGYVYLALPIAGILFVLYSFCHLMETVSKIRSHSAIEAVQPKTREGAG
ncbi:MAG: TRAP transporter small permease [candidate division KSB1 bacterium]|nr:TRAP transporter small permease [candidate division KSB1 bacterium]